MIADGSRRIGAVTFGHALGIVYLAGVLVGIARVDGSPAARVGLALLWPLGLAAFVVTVTGLVAVAALVFPIVGVVLAAAAVAAWYWWPY